MCGRCSCMRALFCNLLQSSEYGLEIGLISACLLQHCQAILKWVSSDAQNKAKKSFYIAERTAHAT